MNRAVLTYDEAVTLVGGGTIDAAMLEGARSVAPVLIAADGAADRLANWGLVPSAIIGDMDSITHPREWQERKVEFVHLREQDSTDFEKCLYSVDAPFFVGVGFTGRRIDHTLAVLHAMLHQPGKQVFLLSEVEAIALLPAGKTVNVPVDVGDIVSLFPITPASGLASQGLKWPVTGLELEAGHLIGTSNRATETRVSVAVDGSGVVLFVPRRHLHGLIAGIQAATEFGERPGSGRHGDVVGVDPP